MNFKRILLMSIVLAVIVSSLSIISAADADNITDLGASNEMALDDNLESPQDDGQNQVNKINDLDKISKEDESGKIALAKDNSTQANTTKNTTSVTPKMTFTDQRTYFGNNIFKVKLVDMKTKKPIAKAKITLKFSNGKKVTTKTNAKGICTYSVGFNPGKYKVTVTYNGVSKSHKFTIKKVSVKVTAKKISTTYGYKYFQVKVTKKNSKLKIKGAKVYVKVGTGKGARTFKLKTDANGIAKYNTSDLKIGKHAVQVKMSSKQVNAKAVKSSITIKKTYGKITAENKTLTFNETLSFLYPIKLTNNVTGKKIRDARLEIKISDGKTIKIINARTGADGKVKLDLYNLDVGTYKLQISCKSSAVTATPVRTLIKITS